MTKQAPLRWRRHRLTTVPAEAVPELLRILAPAQSLVRSLSSTAVEGATGEDVAGEDDCIDLPVLPVAPLDKAATLLRTAAEIEHSLMVQYLYAATSLMGTDAATVTGVAVEEMSHLITVQNLLRLIGEPSYLYRQDDGDIADDDHRLFPFTFQLEPVSNQSLAKYVYAESPPAAPDGVNSQVLKHIMALAAGSPPKLINRVGNLYGLLSAVFATPELLRQLAADGDPVKANWYEAIETFAAEAACFYQGAQNVHLPESAFDAASALTQATDADWDRAKNEADCGVIRARVRVHDVSARLEALEALRDIGLQGEGPTTTVATEKPHFLRFYELFADMFVGPDGRDTVPQPGRVRLLPAGPRIDVKSGGADQPNAITHPTTARWANLANLRYTLLLGALERFLREPVEHRAYLRGWCFAEMYALHKLTKLLGKLPAGKEPAPLAALPFTSPTWSGDDGAEWVDLVAAFEQSQVQVSEMLAPPKDPTQPTDDPTQPTEDPMQPCQFTPDDKLSAKQLLEHLLASDERKLAHSRARVKGSHDRTRTDEVRDVLDWAAGVGDPGHGHAGHGRFWNLQHDAFVHVEIGTNITTPSAPGEDAPIVSQLRSQLMPKKRPKLDLRGSEFARVANWVEDGCRDYPV